MEKKAKLANLKAEIRNKFGYKVIEEVIDCEKEKDKYGKVVRRTYLRIWGGNGGNKKQFLFPPVIYLILRYSSYLFKSLNILLVAK